MVQAIKAAQLADQLRDYLATWTTQDLAGYLFTITQVTLSTDLRQATAWVDILQEKDKTVVMQQLEKKKKTYQNKLHQHLKRHIIPVLHFRYDDQVQLEARFTELLNS